MHVCVVSVHHLVSVQLQGSGMCKKGECLASTVSCKACEMENFALLFWILIIEICLNPV